MIACALIAKSAVDDNEVGRGVPAGATWPAEVRLTSKRQPLANSSSATSAAKRHDSTHNSDLDFAKQERVEFGMVAGPGFKGLRLAGLPQLSNDIAIRV